jgi:putative SOS response-associated peptidase YedK
MPVLFSIEEAKDYLYDDTSLYLKNNFLSKVEEFLEYYAISKFVNSPLNNSKKCIDPVDL